MTNKRFSILFTAISIALCCLTAAFCAAMFRSPVPAASRQCTPATLASAPIALPEEEERTVYLIQTIDGQVCVRYGDGKVLRTGLSASMLPQHDREALEQGITVESQQELTSLLEDLGA